VTYEALFGEIQASYGAYSRLAMYLGFVAVTIPATPVTIWLFDRLSSRLLTWRQEAPSIFIWEVIVVLVLVSSYEIGFSYSLNQVGWAVFETTPVAWTSLWLHSKLAKLIDGRHHAAPAG
jgi:hypothetical protein